MSRNRTLRIVMSMAAWLLLVASVAVAEDEVEARVRADLERFVRTGTSKGRVEIELPPLLSFAFDRARAPGELRTEFSTRAERPYLGRVAVTVALYAGERLIRRGVVSPYVRVAKRVVVPSRDLGRGDVVAAEDLVFEDRDEAKLPADAVLEPEQAIGQRTRRSIRHGQVVRLSQIENVPVIERGDRVRVVIESGLLHVQSIGTAQEAGGVGDWIRVMNLESKKEISGRIDRGGAVHVAF